MIQTNRRKFIQRAASMAAVGTLPLTYVRLGSSEQSAGFSFAFISDSHIQHIRGAEFVRNWDRGLIRAVAETNLLSPKPDFVIYGGDLAQLGTRPELDHGAELLSALNCDIYPILGEHDYYLDLGEYWSDLFKRPHYYSFDHKGVHFVLLNSIVTGDEWTYERWPTAEQRMNEMAGLDNANGSPFIVGDEQREWLKNDLAQMETSTPIVVISHSPLQKIYKSWNFWTDDAEQVQAILAPFDQVTVLYGHVHQIQYNQIGNIAFTSAMATAWPWPYPGSYAHSEQYLPVLTVPMNRADPLFARDATGWQFVDVHTGRAAVNYYLHDNAVRTVAWNAETGHPEDQPFQDSVTGPRRGFCSRGLAA